MTTEDRPPAPLPGEDTVVLFRPVGEAEYRLIERSAWREFPPRLPEQPIFYPVLNEEYATQIARDWNTKQGGTGYVLRFRVRAAFLAEFPVRRVGGEKHLELWVPAERLSELNGNIVASIATLSAWRGDPPVRIGIGEIRPDA